MIDETISHFKIIDKLDQCGEVFLAEDTRLDRKVALKFLPESMHQDSVADDPCVKPNRRLPSITRSSATSMRQGKRTEGLSSRKGRPSSTSSKNGSIHSNTMGGHLGHRTLHENLDALLGGRLRFIAAK